ncbi:MAG: methyltransferase RsmF C-terminal domain-like protein [Phocaeicola sp.]
MNLPTPFVARTRALLGTEEYAQFEAALSTEAPVTIRMNRTKCHYPVLGSPVPWSEQGLYLEKRPTFTFDPHLHAGAYYVQEASSMFVEQALRQYVTEPSVMLDLCAAPGGKSTLARQNLPAGSLLVSNEIMRPRAQVLAENLIKWGDPQVIVTNNDSSSFTSLSHLFDVILADVPCSGEGMFRKDAVAIEEWSEANVELCWKRQREILTNIWPSLKPGGLLIYSTCTYNTEENEENVDWIAQTLGAQVLPLSISDEWNITGNLMSDSSHPVYRFMPHRTSGEGFFLALLRKDSNEEQDERGLEETHYSSQPAFVERFNDSYTADDTHNQGRKKDKKGGKKGKQTPQRGKGNASKGNSSQVAVPLPTYLTDWLLQSEQYQLIEQAGVVTAFSKAHLSTYELLKSELKVIHAGITLAELKGRDYVPHHALAMSTALNPEAFTTVEIGYQQAIAYLRTESIVLQEEVERGFVLLTYRGIPLGFVKQVGNRANNLYPNEWRIRSGYLPEELLLVSGSVE